MDHRTDQGIDRRMKLGSRFLTRLAPSLALAALLPCVVAPTRADDFKLKDGSKISGSIVGYDDNSFRVKTSYGFAIVQKDQVVSIAITPPAKGETNSKAPEASSEAATTPVASANALKASAPVAVKLSDATPIPANHAASTATDKIVAAPAIHTPSAVAPLPTGIAVAQPAPPPKPAPPEPIRESVNGNTYTNETYGFQMYKSPAWEVIAGAQTLMPGAIAAMGTADQTTYLLIGQSAPGKSPASDADAAQRRLSGIMENYRPIEEKHLTVAGSAAIERRFRGTVDMKDWSGVVVLVPHGTQLFTIFGMTVADSDLVQIQENVIARAIASMEFTKQ